MENLLKAFSYNDDEEFVSSEDHGNYVLSQFDYIAEGELAKLRNMEAKKRAIAKLDNLGFITLAMVVDHYGYDSKQRVCFELFGRDRVKATNLKGQAYELLQELALLRIEELTQFQARIDNMSKPVNGFRRTTMSREFEKFIAEKIKEGDFPTTL